MCVQLQPDHQKDRAQEAEKLALAWLLGVSQSAFLTIFLVIPAYVDRPSWKYSFQQFAPNRRHDVVHGAHRIMLFGKFWSTGFFEQCHDKLLKRWAR